MVHAAEETPAAPARRGRGRPRIYQPGERLRINPTVSREVHDALVAIGGTPTDGARIVLDEWYAARQTSNHTGK